LARDCDTAAQYGALIDADDGFSGSSRFASLMAFRAWIAIRTATQAVCDGRRVYLDDLGRVDSSGSMTDALVATVIALRDASIYSVSASVRHR